MPVQKKSACRQGEIESPQQIDTSSKKVRGRAQRSIDLIDAMADGLGIGCGGVMSAPDHAVRAINRLVSARYELELAMRAPGEIISITRQSLDSVLNDLGIVERLIRELAER